MDESLGSEWIGEALVFSGRHNPTWSVPSDRVADLSSRWARMRRLDVPLEQPSRLGYQGVRLVGPQGRWTAANGVVEYRDDRQIECRVDADGEWERLLLSTAPPGLLPVP